MKSIRALRSIKRLPLDGYAIFPSSLSFVILRKELDFLCVSRLVLAKLRLGDLRIWIEKLEPLAKGKISLVPGCPLIAAEA